MSYKIEISEDAIDGLMLAKLKDTRKVLKDILDNPKWSFLAEGDEQDLIEACDRLIAYYAPIKASRAEKNGG